MRTKKTMAPEERRLDFISFCKRVAIICGAAITAGTIIQYLSGFAWALATRPIVNSIDSLREALHEETSVRIQDKRDGATRDSLIVAQIAKLGESQLYPLGSAARERAIEKVRTVPSSLKVIKR